MGQRYQGTEGGVTKCGDARATNEAYGYLGDTIIRRTVLFPTDTWVSLSLQAKGDSKVVPPFVSEECAPCSGDPQVIVTEPDIGLHFRFRAGTHLLSQ